MMIIKRYKELEIKDNPHGVDVRELYNKESAQCIHLLLQPGESLKPHVTPTDVFFYILEGQPAIHIGGKSQEFGPDTLVESPAHIAHHISNPGKVQARILVVKAPRPAGPARLL